MDKIKEQLAILIKEILGTDEEIDKDMGFFDMGVSSLTVVTLVERINELFSVNFNETDIFSYPNINELSEHIQAKLDE